MWIYGKYVSGWWYTYPSEKYEFVSWDDDIPNWMEKYKMFQTTNQIRVSISEVDENWHSPKLFPCWWYSPDIPYIMGKIYIWESALQQWKGNITNMGLLQGPMIPPNPTVIILVMSHLHCDSARWMVSSYPKNERNPNIIVFFKDPENWKIQVKFWWTP